MELEEMKTLWDTMSERIEKLELVNKQHIMEITKQKYKNKFSTIMKYESLGTIICYGIAFWILYNFSKLDTTVLVVCGVISVSTLVVLPFFSLGLLNKLKHLKISQSNYKETILSFEKNKKRLLFIQQFSIVFGLIIFFSVMPVMSRIMGNAPFYENMNTSMIIFITVVLIGVFLFSLWGYRCYKRITEHAGSLLKELEEDV